jgi:hypothetical protein
VPVVEVDTEGKARDLVMPDSDDAPALPGWDKG